MSSTAFMLAPSERDIERNGPYREAMRAPLCVGCGEPSNHQCARCRVPLCQAHMHSADARCMACEADYNALWLVRHFGFRGLPRGHRRYLLIGLAVAWLPVVIAVSLLSWVAAIPLLVLTLVLGVPAILAPSSRRRFLAEVLPRTLSPGAFLADRINARCRECDEPCTDKCPWCGAWLCPKDTCGMCTEIDETFYRDHWVGSYSQGWASLFLQCGSMLGMAAAAVLFGLGVGAVAALGVAFATFGAGVLGYSVVERRAQQAFHEQASSSNQIEAGVVRRPAGQLSGRYTPRRVE